MSDPITFQKFGVITESEDKILRVTNLALSILILVENNYNNSFDVLNKIEYNFITTEKHDAITNASITRDSTLLEQRREYKKLVKDCQMTLIFPIIKANTFLTDQKLFEFIDDYNYIITVLEDIFIRGNLFTIPTMKHINQINKRTKKIK